VYNGGHTKTMALPLGSPAIDVYDVNARRPTSAASPDRKAPLRHRRVRAGNFTISGRTVAGATLSYTGTTTGSTSADASGAYSITVPSGWTAMVTPSFAGCTFSPPT